MKSHELEKVFHHFKYFTLWGMTPPNWFPHFQVQSVLPKSKNHVLWSLPTKPGTCPTPLERRAPRRLLEPLKKCSTQLSMPVPHICCWCPRWLHTYPPPTSVMPSLHYIINYIQILQRKKKPFLTDCLFWRTLCIRWHLSHQSNNEGLQCRGAESPKPTKTEKEPITFPSTGWDVLAVGSQMVGFDNLPVLFKYGSKTQRRSVLPNRTI